MAGMGRTPSRPATAEDVGHLDRRPRQRPRVSRASLTGRRAGLLGKRRVPPLLEKGAGKAIELTWGGLAGKQPGLSGRCRFADRVLAHVRTPGGATGPAQPQLRLARPPSTPGLCPSLTRRTAVVRDPYARWCGRGGTARCPPIPIIGASRPLPPIPAKVLSPSDLPTLVIVHCKTGVC